MGLKNRTVVTTMAVAIVFAAGLVGRAQQTTPPTQQTTPPPQQTAAPAPEGFAYAEACKSCHADIYKAWSQTKHSRTITRLSAENQQKECIGCHTTGPGGKVEKEGKFVNSSVQCESCHGAAAAHAADPAVRTGLTRKPKKETCTVCHNDKSPHYRGFYYEGMLGFSHPVPKS